MCELKMEKYYTRNKGNAGLDGVQFQVGLSTVFLLNAMRNFKGWRISTENEDAGKLDDVVIEFSDGTAVLLQAKHKDNKRINREQLLSDNSRNADFSLPKYCLSYQEIKSRFKVKNIIICTNADLDKKKLSDILELQCASSDSILYYGETCSYVKIKENILPDLKKRSEMYYDKNLQGKDIDRAVITDDNLKDFLEKLQLFSGYPSKSKLDNVINNLLSNGTDFKLCIGTSSQEIYEKVEDWFKDASGEYLDEALANTMFCEIRSNKYRNTLNDYNVSFTCIDIGFMEGKQLFHIDAEGGYLLQVLKVYYALQEKHTLYVNPDDDVEVHKLVLDAFNSSNYEFLIIVFIKKSNQRLGSEINLKLKDILDRHMYKKVVIISSKESIQKITQNDIVELDGTVNWKSLTHECRERLLSKKNIQFQGDNTSLKDLLSTSKVEDYDNAANWDVLEKLVKGEMIQVGKRSPDLDENTAKYYVSRKFEREIDEPCGHLMSTGKQKQVVTQKEIFNVDEKAILISDRAGMGKSTVLRKLATDIKKQNPLSWIIRIELNDYSRFLMNSLKKKKNSITLRALLNSNDETKLTNELEEYVMSTPEKVVLMLDGFDEISPHYTKLILNLIRECYNSPSFAKIIVSTRPIMSLELEDILQEKPFALQAFTKEEQIAFLVSYWEHHLELNHENKDRCEKYAVALIKKMPFWINPENNFTGIPLQIRMLAEIFQENVKWNDAIKWEGCKEFLFGDGEEPILPDRMKLTKLFDMFIDKKFDIFLDKANPKGTALINGLFISNFKKYFENHQCLALKAVLGKETMQHKNVIQLFSRYQYDKCVEREMLKIGLIQVTNNKIDFVHRTFAEYFAAKSIIDISQLENISFNQDECFQNVFIDLILVNNKFTVIRSFIESVLEDVVEYLPVSRLKNYQRFATSHQNPEKHRSQLLHILASEGCISIMRLILKCISHNITELNLTVENRKECNNTLNLLQNLIEKKGINISDELGNTPLHYASQKGYFDMVRYLVYDNKTTDGLVSVVNDMKLLVNHRVNLNMTNKNGYTAFRLAVRRGHCKIVRFLKDQSADINIGDNEDFTALHSATAVGHLEIVKFLIERGLDANRRNKEGVTALHMASLSGHLDIVKYLVDSGSDMKFLNSSDLGVNARDYNGMTALLFAIAGGDLGCIKFLVEYGASVNDSENIGLSALHAAAEKGRLDIVEFLIGSGANVNAITNTRQSVLHSAARKGHLNVVKFLIESGGLADASDDQGHTILHEAVLSGHLDTVKFLIHCGVDINTEDINGCTCLYHAAEKGNLNNVKFLVGFGAHVNARDKLGFTPLYVAAQGGHLDVIRFLVNRGAILNVANKMGFTPLHAASMNGHLDSVKFFIENKVDVNVCNKDGITPLHISCQSGHLETVEFLVKSGADIDKANNVGCFTALRIASRGHLNVVKFLVDNGANIGMRNHDGFTVLHTAAELGQLDILKYFIEIGLNVNVVNNNGYTVLHSASARGHLEIVKFLLQLNIDVNVTNKSGVTPLHVAVQYGGDLETVKYLIGCGADDGATDDQGHTVLQIASREGHVDIVRYLVESRTDHESR